MCNEIEQKQKNTSKNTEMLFFSKERLNLFFAYLDNKEFKNILSFRQYGYNYNGLSLL